MTTKLTDRSTPLARRIQVLAAGTRKEIEGQTVVRVLGIPLTAARILVRLADLERLYAAVRTARSPEAQAEALAAYRVALPRVKAFIWYFEAALKAQFGADSPKLKNFGIGTARGKRGRREALRRACSAARTRQARALAKRAQGRAARTLSEAVLLVARPSGYPNPLSPAKGTGQG